MEATNLKWLFSILPTIGWGDKRLFNGTDDDLKLAHQVIEGIGSLGLVLKRWEYNEGNGELEYNDWYKMLMETEDTFQTYMMKNYSLVNGEFIIGRNIESLEKLARIYKQYYETKASKN